MRPWWLRPTAEAEETSPEEPRNESRSTAKTPEPEEPSPLPEASWSTPSWALDPEAELPLQPERAEPAEPLERPAPSFLERVSEPFALNPPPAREPEPEAESPEEEEDELAAGTLESADDSEGSESAEGTEEVGTPGEAAAERRRRSRRGRGRGRRTGRAAETPSDEEDAEEEALAEEESPLLLVPPPVLQPASPGQRRRESPRRPVERENLFAHPPEIEPARELAREIIVTTVPERPRNDERKIALFCDLENVALGVRDSEVAKFDITIVLERLLEKGKIIVKKAYADWERYSEYKRPFHEAAIEMIDIPQKYYSGKNSADIKMVVDAMDLSYSKEHLDTFVLLSGDSDFSPLVSKLKENNKYVIGIGVKNSSSNLLVDNCDEFIYYEDVWRDQNKNPQLAGLTKKQTEVFNLMIEGIQALIRENKDVLWGSMIKQTMQRKKPSFNEGYYGYSTFSELLEDAERKNIIRLKKDQRSGTYIVIGFAKR